MVCKIDSLVIEKAASLDEQCSVQEAAEIMSRENVGSLVVTRGGRWATLRRRTCCDASG